MRLPTPEFKVLMYGPGLPPAGVRARAHFEENILVVQGRGHWYTIQSGKLRLKTGGYDGRQWLIHWESPSGRVTVMLQGDDAVQAFIRLAPADIAGELHRTRKSYLALGRRFRLLLMLAAVVASFPLLAFAVFWINADRFSQWAAEQVSIEREIQLGELAFRRMRPSLKLIEQGNVVDAVEFIGVRLTGGSPYRFRFHVAEDPAVNAFALPGGHVVVNTGLLRAARGAEEVAGVLAHEASHVILRHTLRNTIHGLGWRAVLAVLFGEYAGGLLGSVWNDMAHELVSLSYSRDLEGEADLEAIHVLRRAGVSAAGMADFFERMARVDSKLPTFLSSHPASMERLATLRETLVREGEYPSQALQVDWNVMRRVLGQ